MSNRTPKPVRAPEGHGQFLAVLAEHLDGGERIPCTGRGRADWTADDDPALERAADQCLDCPVLAACAAYAVGVQEPAGVWGGTVPAERAGTNRPNTEQGAAA